MARCGAFPENVELSFTGAGIDTEGGYNTAVFSACTNTTTNLVFDLKATDTYAGSGDSVNIEGDPFVLVPNPAICAAANAHGVPFRVAGGTGQYAGATGTGRFHITSNLTPCNGLTPPSQVWFEGRDPEAINPKIPAEGEPARTISFRGLLYFSEGFYIHRYTDCFIIYLICRDHNTQWQPPPRIVYGRATN